MSMTENGVTGGEGGLGQDEEAADGPGPAAEADAKGEVKEGAPWAGSSGMMGGGEEDGGDGDDDGDDDDDEEEDEEAERDGANGTRGGVHGFRVCERRRGRRGGERERGGEAGELDAFGKVAVGELDAFGDVGGVGS